MRPLRIELQAFGSYPGKEVVDFRLLAHRGLFVITGETGTGKTTIFDAMCYALYGEMPSKEGKDIRSHHAASSMPTYVVFEFEIDGVTYSVRREPEQERAARRGGETTLDKAKAQLDRLDTGASLATKSSDVNARCVELVGLKADQFKKVILLPQGEVAKFLVAKSTEREELLGQLFGGKVFEVVVDLLRERERDLGSQVGLVNTEIDHALENARAQVVRLHEVLGLDQPAELTTPDLLRQALIATALALAELGARAAAATAEVQAATVAHEGAKSGAERFSRAEALRAQREQLHKQAAVVDADERRGLRSQAARPVVVADDAHGTAVLAHTAAVAVLAGRKAAVTEAFTLLGITPDVGSATAVTAAVQSLRIDVQRRLTLLDGQRISREALIAAQAVVDRLTVEAEAATATLLTHRATVDRVNTERPAIAAETADTDALDRDLTARRTVLDDRAQLDDLLTTLRTTSAAAAAASSRFNAILHRFDITAAPRLAASLTPGEPCPVCGSSKHPRLARDEGEVVSFTSIEAAAGERDRTATAQQAAEGAVLGLRGRLGDDADVPIGDLEARRTTLMQRLTAATAANERLTALDAERTTADAAATAVSLRLAELRGQLDTACAAVANRETALAAATAAASEVDLDGVAAQRRVLAELETLSHGLETHFDRVTSATGALGSSGAHRAEALASSPFAAVDDARADLLDTSTEAAVLRQVADCRDTVRTVAAQLGELEHQGIPGECPDVEAAAARAAAVAAESEGVLGARTAATTADTDARSFLGYHDDLVAGSGDLREQHAVAKKAHKVFSVGGALGMPLRRWVLAIELDRVTAAANVHLQRMTSSRYTLRRRQEVQDARKAFGLDLDVVDAHTGRPRATTSLSGGEQFQASLALALGLADVVSQGGGASGKRFEALFVDEGFGSLDPAALQEAIGALHQLHATGRMVGAITHVEAMKQDLHVGIQVKRLPDGKGSTVMVSP